MLHKKDARLIWVKIGVFLTAKERHIFNIHFIPETLIKFTLNDMNMFDRLHVFVPDHFICHYTVKNNFFVN